MLLASYRFGPELDKPILLPIYSPSGFMITRGWPVLQTEGETQDHKHHKGLWFAYRKVNDEDFWLEQASAAHIKHIKPAKIEAGQNSGRLSTLSHWIGKTGRVLLEEKRDMTFYTQDNQYTIDFEIILTARNDDVTFTDHKDGLFAIQVADWLRESTGTGTYFNANGDTGAKDTWGKRAKWVCLQGKKDGKVVGIAILNHPASVNYPAYWHTRAYGLFSANPLGQYVFQTKTGQAKPVPLNFKIPAGQNRRFRFRVIIYEGTQTRENIEKQFQQFVK